MKYGWASIDRRLKDSENSRQKIISWTQKLISKLEQYALQIIECTFLLYKLIKNPDTTKIASKVSC